MNKAGSTHAEEPVTPSMSQLSLDRLLTPTGTVLVTKTLAIECVGPRGGGLQAVFGCCLPEGRGAYEKI